MTNSGTTELRTGGSAQPAALTSPRTQSNPGWPRRILPALLGVALLSSPAAQAAAPGSVFTTRKVPFNSAVFIDKTTAPEWVYFSGQLDMVTRVGIPSGTCTPESPCAVGGQILVFTSGINGVGLTSGLKYQLLGLSLVNRMLQVPGSTVVPSQFVLIPPRPIKPVGRLVLTVPLQTVITFGPTGGVLQAAAPPVGQVSWWQAEGTAADALGANPGTLSNPEPVTFVPGRIGQAFGFGGQGFVEVPSSPRLEPATVTVAAWVRAASSPGAFSHLLSKGASGCDGASYALYTGAGGGLRFYVSDGISFSVSPDAGAGVWDGNWHFVAGTFDGATVRLYVDGAEVGTGTPAPVVINYALPTNDRLYIGTYQGSCSLPFSGEVDEVQIFSRALMPAEVQGLYIASP